MMIKILSQQKRRLILSFVATGGLVLSTQLMATDISNELNNLLSKNDEITQLSTTMTESLYKLGWSEEVAIKPYLKALQEDWVMKGLLHEHQIKQGYSFEPLECDLTEWQTVLAGEQLITEDWRDHHCLDQLKNNPFDQSNQEVIYLIAAQVMPVELSDKAQALVQLESGLDQPWLFSREVNSSPAVAINQEWFTLSNACESGECAMSIGMKGLSKESNVRMQLKGVYTPTDLSSRGGSAGIVNGDFTMRDEGWSWRRKVGNQYCYQAPRTNIAVVPDVRFDFPNRFNFAQAGGNEAPFSSNIASTSTVEQQLMSVPAYATIKFKYNLTQATSYFGTGENANLRLFIQDLTSGSISSVFSRTTSNGSTGWKNASVDLSAYANKRVNLRFQVCSRVNSSYGAGSAFHGLFKLADVRLDINEPPPPTGQLNQNGPCQLTGSNSTCTTQLDWNAQNTQHVCHWHTTNNSTNLLNCSTQNRGVFAFNETTIEPTQVVMRNHVTEPLNTLAGYLDGTTLDVEQVSALPAPVVEGELTSNSPCEIPSGASRCTVLLSVEAPDSPINCLWTTQPNLRLVSCTSVKNRSFSWPHAVPNGHQFELRGHDTYPQQSNAQRLSGVLLDSEYVFAIQSQNIDPDSYDNVMVRGYDDDNPGDSVVLYAGESAQSHNFHDAGDEDWTIFALGQGQGVRVNTNSTGGIAAQMKAYRVTGDYLEIAPGRWDISLSDLSLIASDTSTGNNSVTVTNNTSSLQVYVVKTYGSSHGTGSNYQISATGL